MNTTATTTRTDEVSATIDGDRIRIKTPYRLKDVVKALPGARWDAKSRTWRVPATPAAALAVVKALNEHGPHIDEDIHAMAETCIRAEEIKDAESLPPIPITKTHPWKHQVEAFWFVAELWEGLPIERRCPVLKNAGNAGAGIFHDMGVGKTYTTIALIENFQFQRTLIICPKSVIATWPKEFERHSTSKFNVIPLDTGQVSSRTKQALLQICLAEKRNEPIVIVINYEAVWREKFAELVLSINWDLIVLDEAHKIKSPGGRVSRFCAKVGQNTKHRLALTGSPLPHSPLDAYALYRFLDPGIFGTSFVRFRARYAVMGGYGGHEVLGYQHQDELNQKFYSIAHRVKKSDVLDLPPVIHEVRQIQLSADAANLYRQIEREFIADVEGGVITAANALARLLRLQQITSGFGVTEDGETHAVGDEKHNEVREILDDLDDSEPVVVFCRFKHDLARVKAATESRQRRYLELSGRINELAEWQQADDGDVLGVQIQAGGVGIDLTRAAYCIYYSLGFSLGDYEQSLARLDRPGQTRSITYLHLVAQNTVDEKVYDALQKRADVIESILSQIQEKRHDSNKDETQGVCGPDG